MTAGRWVAVDKTTGRPVITGRPGHSKAHVRRSALDDWGVPAQDLAVEWRPDPKDAA